MTKYKYLIPNLSFVVLLAFGGIAVTAPVYLTGCASILPGNDATLVNAERVNSVAFTTFDSFLALERQQEVYVKANLPQVHSFANNLRVNGQRYLQSARAATEAYRTSRTPENKANLNTAIAVLQAILAQIPNYTTQIATKGL
jgi:hypothetical protein